MFHAHGLQKQSCTLLAVLSGKISGSKVVGYPFPELKSTGRLEVTLKFDFFFSCLGARFVR